MMIRHVFLAGVAMMSAPAFAQTAATPADTASQPAQEAVTKAQATPAPAQSVEGVAPQTADAQPSTADGTAGQVAQVVDQEFASYDTNKDGKLDKAEFGAWMVKLKSMSDPSAKVGTPKTTAWVNSAFSQADADRNRVLTKSELTGFLSQGQS